MLSFLYGPTLRIIYDYWKNHSFAVQTFVGKMVDVYHVYKMRNSNIQADVRTNH